MANLKNVIYISNEDYATLVSTGTVTIDGVTLTYDEDNLYVTPDKTYYLTTSTASSAGAIPYLASLSGSGLTGEGKYMHFSAGTTPPSSATFTGSTTNSVVTSGTTKHLEASFSGTNATITPTLGAATTTYLGGAFTGTSGSTTSISGNVSVATSTHTHDFTATGNVTLSNTSTSGIAFVESITGVNVSASGSYMHFSAGTTPPSSAAFSGTKTNSLVTSVGWHTTNTKVLYGSRTTSGSGTSARRTLEVKTYDLNVSKGDYTPAGSVSLTAGTAPSLTFNSTSTSGEYFINSITGGDASVTSKYLTASFTGTSASTSTPSGVVSVATSNHTHGYTPSGTVAIESNSSSASGRVQVVTAQGTITGASFTPAGTITLSAYDSTSTGRVSFIAAVSNGDYTPSGSIAFVSGTAPTLTFDTTSTSGEFYVTTLSGSISGVTKYLTLEDDD